MKPAAHLPDVNIAIIPSSNLAGKKNNTRHKLSHIIYMPEIIGNVQNEV